MKYSGVWYIVPSMVIVIMGCVEEIRVCQWEIGFSVNDDKSDWLECIVSRMVDVGRYSGCNLGGLKGLRVVYGKRAERLRVDTKCA